jgi:hypothetical protein
MAEAPPLSHRQHVLDVTNLLRAVSQVKDPARLPEIELEVGSMGSDAVSYAAAVMALLEGSRPSDRIAMNAFRPAFLRYGLDLAAQYDSHRARSFILGALAEGLAAFPKHFVHLRAREHREPQAAPAPTREEQRRFAAYCAAQLSALGLDAEGVFEVIHQDLVAEDWRHEAREVIEGGLTPLLRASFLGDEDKARWRAVFAGEDDAWESLQVHLVGAYELPFRTPG